jgi:hypothetical protein
MRGRDPFEPCRFGAPLSFGLKSNTLIDTRFVKKALELK